MENLELKDETTPQYEVLRDLVYLDEVCKRLRSGDFHPDEKGQLESYRKELKSRIYEELVDLGYNPTYLIGSAERGKFCPMLASKLVEKLKGEYD